MGSIRRINSSLDQLRKIISDLDIKINNTIDDFSLNLQRQALVNQLEDLQSQLYQEKIKREKEIIQIRLIGNNVNYGSLPLNFVSGIISNFSKSIHDTSKYLKFGGKGGKKKETIINQTIDLRLEDIGRGSTIFYISGKTSPDMFGQSILQNCLENTFSLFKSKSLDEITNNLPGVGGSSLKHISNFLNELVNDNLECDLKWNSPDEREYLWKGKKDNILSLYNTINQMEISEPTVINFEGELITISAKGNFEILTAENHRIVGTFPNDLLEKMQEFHISDYCKGVIEKTTIFNPLTEKEKIEYNLISIT